MAQSKVRWISFNKDQNLTEHLQKYILSKLQSERELLSYNSGERPAFEVVTLPLGLVAGDTVLGRAPETLEHAVAPVSRSEPGFAFLRLLQRLLGSLPLVHVDYASGALHPLRHRLLDHPRHRRPLRRGFPHLDVFRG